MGFQSVKGTQSDPWFFCREANKIYKEKYAEVIENPTRAFPLKVLPLEPVIILRDIKQFIDEVCPNCSERLPTVHQDILKGQKYTQMAQCCGPSDMCELLHNIQELRPVTFEKLRDEGWRQQYREKINDILCCLERRLSDNEIMDANTFPHITEIPNFTIQGLPGFSYPNYRIPPLVRLHRPVNINKNEEKGKSLLEFVKDGEVPQLSYNVDGVNATFGVENMLYMNFPSSPLEALHDFLCGGEVFSISGGVKATMSLNLPNLAFSAHIHMHLDPCLSQFLPPISLPTIELPTLQLGGGAEFGIYANAKLLSNNFGTAFNVASSFISPLIREDVGAAAMLAIKGVPFKHGMKIDVNFPSYGKGLEWSIKDE